MFTDSVINDNAYSTVFDNYTLRSVFSRLKFTTTAEKMVVTYYNNIYANFSQWSDIGVIIDGVYTATPHSYANNTMNTAVFGFSPGTKTIELINGLQSKPSNTVLGTFVQSVIFYGGSTSAVDDGDPVNRVAIYGDSITVGANATTPTSEGWPMLLRAAGQPVALEAWGFRSLYDDASTAELRAMLVAQIASFAPGSVWLAIGTNDYGLNKWSAASFGTAYAALLDDLHTTLPDATIYAQTPIERTTETANDSGSTLGDYRTQIASAQSTRSAWCTLVDGTGAAFPQAPGDLADGVHPTTAGHAKYYNAVKGYFGIA